MGVKSRMKPVVVKQLEMKKRRFFQDGEWQETEMAAFVGINVTSRGSELGIGMVRPNGALLFRTMSAPYQLMMAWRGAQILDATMEVEKSMIGAALKLGARSRYPAQGRYLAVFQKSMPEIDKLRDEIMQQTIQNDLLEEMLKICNNPAYKLEIDPLELERELVAHAIRCTPEVRKVLDWAEQKGVRLTEIWTESCRQLLNGESLSHCCKKLGIEQLPVEQADGSGLPVKIGFLDQEVIYRSLRYGEALELHCVVPRYNMARGYPVVRLANGNVWVIRKAFWDGEQIMVEFGALATKQCSAPERVGSVATLSEKAPELIGVTLPDDVLPDDARVDQKSRQQGYISTEMVGHKLRRKLGGWLRRLQH